MRPKFIGAGSIQNFFPRHFLCIGFAKITIIWYVCIIMAITKSAKKAIRQNARRREHNLVYLKAMKKLVKEAHTLTTQKKIDEAKAILPKVYQILDKAAKVGIIKKNAASRKKSRLTKLIERSK